jgi:hypothetical protein
LVFASGFISGGLDGTKFVVSAAKPAADCKHKDNIAKIDAPQNFMLQRV